MDKYFPLRILTCIVLICLIAVGINMAGQKPLWNDELFSQVSSVESHSYAEIFGGDMGEGNNSPLFFLTQKIICHVLNYRFPQPWDGSWFAYDYRSQIILRLGPIFFMFSSVALIFYYFARYFSFWIGCFSLLVSVSSCIVWYYAPEARPYALWYFLTTAQSLLFLTIFRQKTLKSPAGRWLVAVHVLMSLTISLSIAQIVVVSFLLWIAIDRDWKRYIPLTVIPAGIVLYYYSHAPHLKFFIKQENFLELITPSFPKGQMAVVALYMLFFLVCCFLKRARLFRFNAKEAFMEGKGYLPLMLFTFLIAAALLMMIKMGETEEKAGFELSLRYFIFLSPVAITAITLFMVDLSRVFKRRKWLLSNIVIGMVGLFMIVFLRDCIWIFPFF